MPGQRRKNKYMFSITNAQYCVSDLFQLHGSCNLALVSHDKITDDASANSMALNVISCTCMNIN